MSNELKKTEKIVEVLNVSPARLTSIWVPVPFDVTMKVFPIGDVVYEAVLGKNQKGHDIWHTAPGAPIRLDTDDQFEVTHGQVYDLNNEIDRFKYHIIVADEHVARTKSEVNPGIHTHYFYDRENEATTVVSKADATFEAMQFVGTLNDVDRRNFAFYHRQSVREMSEMQILAYVKGVAHHQPELVLKYKEDRHISERAFIQQLVQFNILVTEAGQYRMPGTNGEVLAIDESAMVHWVQQPKNTAIVQQWYTALKRAGLPVHEGATEAQ